MYTVKITHGKEDFAAVKEIRTAVFIQEQGFHNEFDDIDERAIHAVLYDGRLPIATGRTFAEDNGSYIIGRIAVIKSYRGKGIGKSVVSALEQQAKKMGACCIQLSAQVHALDFYKKLGYMETGAKYMDEYCPHVQMQKIF